MSRLLTCVVCRERAAKIMCAACDRSYERFCRTRVGDTITLIEWAAARGRRLERRRTRRTP